MKDLPRCIRHRVFRVTEPDMVLASLKVANVNLLELCTFQ